MLWTPSWWLKGGALGLSIGLAATACGGDDDDDSSSGAKAGKGAAGTGAAGSSGRGGSGGKAGSASVAGAGSGGIGGTGNSSGTAGTAGTSNVAGTAGTGSGGVSGGGTGGTGGGGTGGVSGTSGTGGTPGGQGGVGNAGESGSGGEGGDAVGASGAGGSGPEAVCGNGTVESGEDCDGSNTDNLDGCNSKCQSEVTAGPGLALALPDNGYTGTLGSMVCVNLAVSAKGDGLVDSVSVQVGITHTWAGDLTLKLVSPANTVVTLMSRVGLLEVADDGQGSGGDSSNLLASSPISFRDGGPKSAENMGNTAIDTDTICLSDAACVYAPAAGAAAAGTLATFAGQAAVGTWRLCAADALSGDLGSIELVRLSVVQ